MVGFQILEYIALGYQEQIKGNRQVELIIPVLYYHGKEKWELKPFSSYFEIYPEEFKKFIPAYHAEFIDLLKLSTEQLISLQNGLLRSAMLIQRHYFDADQIQANFENIVNSLSPYLEKNLSYTIFVYMLQFIDYDKTLLNQQLDSFSSEINNNIMSLYDKLMSEGIEKGIEKAIINAHDNGIALDTIRLITGETAEKIQEVLKKNGRGKV
jgi:hypothetical protein